MSYLLISIVALFAGLLLFPVLRRSPQALAGIDGFILTILGGLVALHLLPHSILEGGQAAVFAALAGLFLPVLMEKSLVQSATRGKAAFFLGPLAVLGLLAHAFLDGAALSSGGLDMDLLPDLLPDGGHGHAEHAHTGHAHAEHAGHAHIEHTGHAHAEHAGHAHAGHDHTGHGHEGHAHAEDGSLLALGVILHRFPMGLGLAWVLAATRGMKAALGAASLISLVTVAGFFLGMKDLPLLGEQGLAAFQAFVAGTLMHVVFHHGPPRDFYEKPLARPIATIGALLGVGAMALLVENHPTVKHCTEEIAAGPTFMTLAYQAAPLLLLAFAAAAAARVFLRLPTMGWLGRILSLDTSTTRHLSHTPAPICSCDAMPLYQRLTRLGVPSWAAVFVLILGLSVGVDTLLLSLPLLGEGMTLARVLSVTGLALLSAPLVAMMARNTQEKASLVVPPRRSWSVRFTDGVRYGFEEVVDHTMPWVLVGLALASMVESILHIDGMTHELPYGLDVALMTLGAIPFYICASGATPLVAILMHKGLSAGAGLAFLVAGPLTNGAIHGLLRRTRGKKAAFSFGGIAVLFAAGLGLVVNGVSNGFAPLELHSTVVQSPGVVQQISLVVLGALVLWSLFRRGPRDLVSNLIPRPAVEKTDQEKANACSHGHLHHR